MAGGKNADIDVYSAETVAEAEKRDKVIKNRLNYSEKSLYEAAVALEWFISNRTYRTYGYKSFAELADKRYGIKKTEAYDYVGVVERFGRSDICKSYSISQLIAALPLTDFEIFAYLNPEMSVRDIKKTVRKLTKPPPVEASPSGADAGAESCIGNGKLNNDKNRLNIDKPLASFQTIMDYDALKASSSLFFKELEKSVKNAFLEGAGEVRLCLVWDRENPKNPEDTNN